MPFGKSLCLEPSIFHFSGVLKLHVDVAVEQVAVTQDFEGVVDADHTFQVSWKCLCGFNYNHYLGGTREDERIDSPLPLSILCDTVTSQLLFGLAGYRGR